MGAGPAGDRGGRRPATPARPARAPARPWPSRRRARRRPTAGSRRPRPRERELSRSLARRRGDPALAAAAHRAGRRRRWRCWRSRCWSDAAGAAGPSRRRCEDAPVSSPRWRARSPSCATTSSSTGPGCSAPRSIRRSPPEEIARALTEPRPTSLVVAGIYERLVRAARGAGAPLRPLAREPVFGALCRELARAELLATRAPRDGRDELGAIDRRLRGPHADALDALLKMGPRTRLDAAALSRWIAAVEAERRQGGRGWAAPGLSLADLDLDFPVELDALSAVFSNLLRNAQAAVDGAPEARVVIRADRERDVTGRQWVTLLVGDSAPAGADAGVDRGARERTGPGDRARSGARLARPPGRAPRAGAARQAGGGVVSAVSSPADARLRFVVCEDGAEYLERFRRFLGDVVRFSPGARLRRSARRRGRRRRAPARPRFSPHAGRAAGRRAGAGARRRSTPARARRLAETQGILILRRLRAAGVALPAILFADLDDAGQRAFLARTLAPLTVAGSRLGIAEIATLLRATTGNQNRSIRSRRVVRGRRELRLGWSGLLATLIVCHGARPASRPPRRRARTRARRGPEPAPAREPLRRWTRRCRLRRSIGAREPPAPTSNPRPPARAPSRLCQPSFRRPSMGPPTRGAVRRRGRDGDRRRSERKSRPPRLTAPAAARRPPSASSRRSTTFPRGISPRAFRRFFRYSDSISGINSREQERDLRDDRAPVPSTCGSADRVSLWPRLALGVWQSQTTLLRPSRDLQRERQRHGLPPSRTAPRSPRTPSSSSSTPPSFFTWPSTSSSASVPRPMPTCFTPPTA